MANKNKAYVKRFAEDISTDLAKSAYNQPKQHLIKINCNWTDPMYGGIDINVSTGFYSTEMPTQEMIVNYLLTGIVLSGDYNNGEVFVFFKALEDSNTTIVFLDMPWDDNPTRYSREDLTYAFSIDVDDNEEVLYFEIVG